MHMRVACVPKGGLEGDGGSCVGCAVGSFRVPLMGFLCGRRWTCLCGRLRACCKAELGWASMQASMCP